MKYLTMNIGGGPSIYDICPFDVDQLSEQNSYERCFSAAVGSGQSGDKGGIHGQGKPFKGVVRLRIIFEGKIIEGKYHDKEKIRFGNTTYFNVIMNRAYAFSCERVKVYSTNNIYGSINMFDILSNNYYT